MKRNGSIPKRRTRPSRLLRRARSSDNAATLRIELALALYPRYLDFMEGGASDDMPPYGYESAAGDAVRAVDHLIDALAEQAGGEGVQ